MKKKLTHLLLIGAACSVSGVAHSQTVFSGHLAEISVPTEVNWWAILLATFVNMMMGWLWYSSLLFEKRWMALVGWSKEEAKEKRAQGARWYPIVIPVSFVFAFCLALLIHSLHIDSILGGLKLGLLVGLGLMAIPGFPRNAFAGRPFRLYLINHGYWVISAVVLCLILTVWQ